MSKEVKSLGGWFSGPVRRILRELDTKAGARFYGRPEFPNGIIIGEGKDAIHLTPDQLSKLMRLLEKKK